MSTGLISIIAMHSSRGLPRIVMGTIMLDHKFLVCSSTIYARAWAKFSARS